MFLIRVINKLEPSCLLITDLADDIYKQVKRLEEFNCYSLGYFLKGLIECIRGNTYDASIYFHDWILSEEKDSSVVFLLPPNSFYTTPMPETMPMIAVTYPDGFGDGSERRARTLFDMVHLYVDILPMYEHAVDLMAGCALALAKYYGTLNRPELIIPTVEKALIKYGYTSGKVNHLKAAHQALVLMAEGKEIPLHIHKFVGEDTGVLKKKFCQNPFTRFDVCHDDPYPVVRVCCNHWLPTPIGDLSQSVEDVLNSPTAQDIRRSILDGSFKYCDHLNCQFMSVDELPNREDITDLDQRRAIDEGILTVNRVSEVLVGIDETCNLACPSCRVNIIGLKKGERFDTIMKATDEILIPLIRTAKSIMINPAGEAFVSKPSRRILEYVNRERCPELVVNLITNGTRLSEAEWEKLPGLHDMIGYIRVSLDSCHKETFEKLRRPAKFEKTMQNMAFLAGLHREKVFEGFFFSFTYQADNFHEMPEFVQFALDHGINGVMFERIMNMAAFSDEEYRQKAVHMLDHPRHAEFLEVLRHPIMRHEIVMGDIPGLLAQELCAAV